MDNGQDYYLKMVAKAQEDFLAGKQRDFGFVRPIILESWKRCKEKGLEPESDMKLKRLSENELKKILQDNSELIQISKRVLSSVYDTFKKLEATIILTDYSGCVLHSWGDGRFIEKDKGVNVGSIGTVCSEATIGTSGIGTALAIGQALQVTAAEHFLKIQHLKSCFAAPIFYKSGVVGGINLTLRKKYFDPHTLGIVIAAAKAIESQLREKETAVELALANEYLNAAVENISEGIICIDSEGIIKKLNSAAFKILDIDRADFRENGMRIDEILASDPPINIILKMRYRYSEHEIILEGKSGKKYCLLTIKTLTNEKMENIGFLLLFKGPSQYKKIVTNLSDMHSKFCFADIIGKNAELQKSINLAMRAGINNSNVLLVAESGTGKEIFAHSIHSTSNYATGPFVKINCGAIPRELIESELFGYERGAFTGANSKGRPGKFELADGGTIFLDEIGSMPINMQAKLLSIIEDKEIVRIGGKTLIYIDVRIIAATNRDLKEGVANGTFRQDLFYRLNVVEISIPPLRERKDDIPLLIDHFIYKYNLRYGKKIYGVSAKVMNLLVNYKWPGNVRQLENVVERAYAIMKKGIIEVDHLPEEINDKLNQNGFSKDVFALKKVEKRTIEKALGYSKGNISMAAKTLEITRKTLYRKMKEYEIGNIYKNERIV